MQGDQVLRQRTRLFRSTLRSMRAAMVNIGKRPADEQAAALTDVAHLALIEACRLQDSSSPNHQILATAAIALERVTNRKSSF